MTSKVYLSLLWHFTFTGAMVDVATGSYTMAMAAVALHAAFAYKLGDWFAPLVDRYFGLEGIAMPHGTTGCFAPIAVVMEAILNKIPGIKDIDVNPTKLQSKFGAICDPSVMGGIMGVIIGILAGYDVKGILTLAIQMAAVIVLMPVVVKYIMGGLLPISEVAKKKLQEKFKGAQFFIGLDCALLLGDPVVVTASLLFIPITILVAAIVPGNVILPFGDLPTIGFFIAMAVAVHGGNLFRTIISGSLVMAFTIWVSNQMIALHTKLAQGVGQVGEGISQVASLDQGGSPFTYVLVQLMNLSDVGGLIVVGVIYFGCAMNLRRVDIMKDYLRELVRLQKRGEAVGIYSACTGNSLVLEACMRHALETNTVLLIESTANQVDQYGGTSLQKKLTRVAHCAKVIAEDFHITR